MSEYEPLPAEYRAVGLLGICFYSIILISSLTSVYLGIKSNSTSLFFYSLALMAIFEYPRYFDMAINEDYTFITGYCLHIVAGMFFFFSYCILCYQWCNILEVGTYFKFLYSKYGLITSNIIFDIIEFVSIGICGSSSSLQSYFHSSAFIVFNCIEAFKNVVYFGILSYYGILLLRKLWNYSYEERMHGVTISSIMYDFIDCFKPVQGKEMISITTDEETIHSTSDSSLSRKSSTNEPTVFLAVVLRFTNVLILSLICFLLRVIMIIVKIISLSIQKKITNPNFTRFGVGWFFCTDFIPRVIPSLAFMYLMRTKRPKEARRSLYNKSKNANELKEMKPSLSNVENNNSNHDYNSEALNQLHTNDI